MKKVVLASLLVVLMMATQAQGVEGATAAYIRGASPPWGQNTNENAMTTVFGPVGVGWSDLRMSGGVAPFLPGSGYTFIFLEGSDSSANELNTFLSANRTAIEDFVNQGGALLLNSAPNQGSIINFGFGGITLNYSDYSPSVVAADPSHPVFSGPHGVTGTSFTGNYFGHATVSGGGITSIILGVGSRIVLGEKPWGGGLLLVGGMTTNNFHSPQPGATNLRANIIEYASGGANKDTDGDGLPDYWENLYGTNPNNPNDPVLTQDVDGDGLNWLQEFQHGTNPLNPDTDGDGVNDGKEVAIGTDPTVKDGPVTIVEMGPGAGFGTAYYRFVDLGVPDQGLQERPLILPTGYRVFYGGKPGGDVASDYPAFFDVGLNQFQGLIDQRWGMQGVPQVFVRVAPIRNVAGAVFVGTLSNEVSTYFSGSKFTSAGSNGESVNTQDVSTSSSGCSLTNRSGVDGSAAAATLAFLFLPMAVLLLRRKVRRKG